MNQSTSEQTPALSLDSAARADLVTARQTVRLAASGADYADLDAAARMLDRVLSRSCPHDPAGYIVGPEDGRQLVTCPACGVSWYLG